MVVIALVLILLGALAIVFAFAFTDAGTGGTYLGVDVNILSAFLIGVAAGAAIVWGLWILKWGTKRTLAHRRERKELSQLNAKLERVEAERRADGDTVTDRDRI